MANGQFEKGNPGGPGRPKRPVELKYLEWLTTRVTAERWQNIVDKAILQAEEGDSTARAWLSKHLVGDDPLALHSMMEDLAAIRSELEALRVQRSNQATPGVSSGDSGRASDSPPSDGG